MIETDCLFKCWGGSPEFYQDQELLLHSDIYLETVLLPGLVSYDNTGRTEKTGRGDSCGPLVVEFRQELLRYH